MTLLLLLHGSGKTSLSLKLCVAVPSSNVAVTSRPTKPSQTPHPCSSSGGSFLKLVTHPTSVDSKPHDKPTPTHNSVRLDSAQLKLGSTRPGSARFKLSSADSSGQPFHELHGLSRPCQHSSSAAVVVTLRQQPAATSATTLRLLLLLLHQCCQLLLLLVFLHCHEGGGPAQPHCCHKATAATAAAAGGSCGGGWGTAAVLDPGAPTPAGTGGPAVTGRM